MSSFTGKSGTALNRVYERLRKRSYRQWQTTPVTWPSTWLLKRDAHQAYVKGVHDALYELGRTAKVG